MSSWNPSMEQCITLKETINIYMSPWKWKYRTLYHMKSITEINTLQCLHENEVQKIVSMKIITRN